MKELLLTVAKGLVEFPDQVTVEVDEPNEEGVIVYHLHVAESDMGRIIGKQGRQFVPLCMLLQPVTMKK